MQNLDYDFIIIIWYLCLTWVEMQLHISLLDIITDLIMNLCWMFVMFDSQVTWMLERRLQLSPPMSVPQTVKAEENTEAAQRKRDTSTGCDKTRAKSNER